MAAKKTADSISVARSATVLCKGRVVLYLPNEAWHSFSFLVAATQVEIIKTNYILRESEYHTSSKVTKWSAHRGWWSTWWRDSKPWSIGEMGNTEKCNLKKTDLDIFTYIYTRIINRTFFLLNKNSFFYLIGSAYLGSFSLLENACEASHMCCLLAYPTEKRSPTIHNVDSLGKPSLEMRSHWHLSIC